MEQTMDSFALECMGARAEAEWDPAVEEWSGRVIEPAGVHAAFHGRTKDELEQAFRDVMEARLEFCALLAQRQAPDYPPPLFLRDPCFGLVESEDAWKSVISDSDKYRDFRPHMTEVVSLDGERWLSVQDAFTGMKLADGVLWNAVLDLPGEAGAAPQRVLYLFVSAWKLARGTDFSFGENAGRPAGQADDAGEAEA